MLGSLATVVVVVVVVVGAAATAGVVIGVVIGMVESLTSLSPCTPSGSMQACGLAANTSLFFLNSDSLYPRTCHQIL